MWAQSILIQILLVGWNLDWSVPDCIIKISLISLVSSWFAYPTVLPSLPATRSSGFKPPPQVSKKLRPLGTRLCSLLISSMVCKLPFSCQHFHWQYWWMQSQLVAMTKAVTMMHLHGMCICTCSGSEILSEGSGREWIVVNSVHPVVWDSWTCRQMHQDTLEMRIFPGESIKREIACGL